MTSDTRIFVETVKRRGQWPLWRRFAWLALYVAMFAWAALIVLRHA